jgi:hypothetical protein
MFSRLSYKQLTGQEPPPGGNLDLKILDELLNAEDHQHCCQACHTSSYQGEAGG